MQLFKPQRWGFIHILNANLLGSKPSVYISTPRSAYMTLFFVFPIAVV